MTDSTVRSWEEPGNAATRHPEYVASVPMESVDLGGVSLTAPLGSITYTKGTYGEMWQWIGKGNSLISLVVAVRPGAQESVDGVRHRLLAESDRVSAPTQSPSDRERLRPESVDVPGAIAAFKVQVDGTREGLQLHNAVLVASDSVATCLVHAAVTDTEDGRRLASSLLSSLQLLG